MNVDRNADRRQGPHVSHGDVADVRRRAWRAAMQATGSLSAVLDDEIRARSELDLQAYDAMLHVFESGPAGVRMTDLAREIVLSKAGLTSLVDRLQARGLVQRTPDPDDRRAMRITLTDRGEEAFRAAARIHLDGIHEHVTQHLTDEEAHVIATAFERLRRISLDGG
jgi:DNA-binding MarR family transcriptional regulator